jgi:hypothetical protein
MWRNHNGPHVCADLEAERIRLNSLEGRRVELKHTRKQILRQTEFYLGVRWLLKKAADEDGENRTGEVMNMA